MDLGRVSIILPTYNGSKFLSRSIDSCLNQTYRNIELIIIDDGSTDTTKEIIGSYNDERIFYVRHEMNRGLPAALNTGFSRSSGKYLTWTSDDNYYLLNAIEKMVTFLKERICDFVYCDYYRFKNEDHEDKILVKLPDVLKLEEGNYVGACFLYSKELANIIGEYDPNTNFAEDYDYWIRISKKFRMYHLNEPLYLYREHVGSLSRRRREVMIVSILVQFKNDLIEIDQAVAAIIDSILNTSRFSRFTKSGIIGIQLSEKMIMKAVFAGRSERILKEFKKGEIDFKTARLALIKIAKGFGSG